MKRIVTCITLLMMVSNAYAMPMQSVSIANDIIDSVKDGITGIINALINVIKNLLTSVADAITYPFELLGDTFRHSVDWFNSTLGGFSPIGYVIVISLTVMIIFWFINRDEEELG